MIGTVLEIEDLKRADSPEKIAAWFEKLGYKVEIDKTNIEGLELPTRCDEAICDGRSLMLRENPKLEIFLLELRPEEFKSDRSIHYRLLTILNSLWKPDSNLLLIATQNYRQFAIAIPKTNTETATGQKLPIKWWQIDRKNPTNYDLY